MYHVLIYSIPKRQFPKLISKARYIKKSNAILMLGHSNWRSGHKQNGMWFDLDR